MRPAYKLEVSGRPLPLPALSVEVVDSLGPTSDTLRVKLPGQTGTGDIVEHSRHGVRIAVALGFEGAPLEDFGEFVVSGIAFEGAPYTVTISADTPAVLEAIKAPVDRSWDDIFLPDLVSSIAGKYGLEPVLSERLRSAHVAHEDQAAESDLAFLNRIGKRYNAQFSIKEGRALFLVVGDGKSASGGDLPRHDVALEGEGLTWDVSYRDRPMYGTVEAAWTDLATGLARTATAGQGEPIYRMRHPFATEGEARHAATALRDDFERDVAGFSLSMPGRPQIRAGHLVNCTTRFPVSGLWYVAEAQHVYDPSGLTTRLQLNAHNDRS